MTEETQNLADSLPAPISDETAISEQVVSLPETDQVVEPLDEKKFSQAEIDAMIGKRLAREQRKWERDQSRRTTAAVHQMAQELPPLEQFETPEAYADALAVRKAEEILRQRDVQSHVAALEDRYAELEDKARDKYDDFEQVAYNPKLRVTGEMAEVIKGSKIGPDLAYWLGSNPKEADRISKLSPLSQACEIGKIEAGLMASPPQKKTSSAPAPITPVTARVTKSGVTDTTDPRSVQTMTTSEWINAERQRQIAKFQATRKR